MKWTHYLIIGQLMGLAFMGGLLMRLLLNMDAKLDALFAAECGTTPVLEKSDGH